MYYQYYENEEIQNYIKNNVKNFIIIDSNNLNVEDVVKKIFLYIDKF